MPCPAVQRTFIDIVCSGYGFTVEVEIQLYSSVSKLSLDHLREARNALLGPCCRACGMLVHLGGWHAAFKHSGEPLSVTLDSHSPYVAHGCHVRQMDAKLGHASP